MERGRGTVCIVEGGGEDRTAHVQLHVHTEKFMLMAKQRNGEERKEEVNNQSKTDVIYMYMYRYIQIQRIHVWWR